MSAPPLTSGRTLVDLDGDVLAHCARHLGARDVASLAMACRPLHAAAYCDAVWYRLYSDIGCVDDDGWDWRIMDLHCCFLFGFCTRQVLSNIRVEFGRTYAVGKELQTLELEQWPFQQVPHGALGLRELYIRRHTEVHQMKFDDPLSSIYYLNPIGSTPNHLMLDKNRVCFSQGPVAKVINVTCSLDKESVETYRSHSARITCMRLFPLIDTPLFRSDTHTKEKALVTSSTDRTVRLCWKGYSRSYKGHSGPVTALSDKLLCDGEFKVLASGGEDCTIRLWSMSTRAKSHSLISTLHGHEKTLSLLSVAWSKCGTRWHLLPVSRHLVLGVLTLSGPPIAMKCHQSLCYIAAGSEVTAIDLRTMKKASVLALRNQRIISCEMLPSEWLICTGVKDKALLWDIRKSQELADTVAELHSDGPVTLLHLDPYKVVTGAPLDGQVHVWETQTGRLLNTLSCGEPGKSAGGTTVSAMAVDGCRIATTESSAEGILLHYRDFMSSSVPVALPGKEVSKFWGAQEYDDGASEDED